VGGGIMCLYLSLNERAVDAEEEVATYLLEADIGEIKYQHLLGKTC